MPCSKIFLYEEKSNPSIYPRLPRWWEVWFSLEFTWWRTWYQLLPFPFFTSILRLNPQEVHLKAFFLGNHEDRFWFQKLGLNLFLFQILATESLRTVILLILRFWFPFQLLLIYREVWRRSILCFLHFIQSSKHLFGRTLSWLQLCGIPWHFCHHPVSFLWVHWVN